MDKLIATDLQLQLDSSGFWTDSTSILKYIRNETIRFQTFVANRVTTIKEASNVSQWRYINTIENSAASASRGLTADALLKCSLWRKSFFKDQNRSSLGYYLLQCWLNQMILKLRRKELLSMSSQKHITLVLILWCTITHHGNASWELLYGFLNLNSYCEICV